MNTTMNETLAGLLRAVRPFANRSRKIAALHDACVERRHDSMRVTATDMEIACTITTAPDGDGLGSCLHDSASGEPVTDRNALDYPCVRPGYPAPVAPAAIYRLAFADVRRLADHVAVAADDESSRYALGGVLIESDRQTLIAVATDGRRLHAARVLPDATTGEVPAGTIVPARLLPAFVAAVRQAARVCLGAGGQRLERAVRDGTVTLVIGNGECLLAWEDAMQRVTVAAAGKLMEGRFPRWRDVVPMAGGGVENGVDAPSLAEWCRKVVRETRIVAAAAAERHMAEVAAKQPGPAADRAKARAVKRARETFNHPRGVQFSPDGVDACGCEMAARIPFTSRTRLDPMFVAEGLDAAVALGGRDEVALKIDTPQAPVTITAGLWSSGGSGCWIVMMPMVD